MAMNGPITGGQVGRPRKTAIADSGGAVRPSASSRSTAGRPSSPEDPIEKQRQVERRRRNRESAAKCRQRLKERLEWCEEEVDSLEGHNKALINEKQLLFIEVQKTMYELERHKHRCNDTQELQQISHKLVAAVNAPVGNHTARSQDYTAGPSHTTTANQ